MKNKAHKIFDRYGIGVCPQISSQVLIANAYSITTTEVAMMSRLACNFGFLDTSSSPGNYSSLSTNS
jgi:hypothetical protein